MAQGVQISDRVDVQAILQTSVAPQEGFGKNVFIIDSDEIPTDRRVVEVTEGDYADVLDSAGLPYAYADSQFGQNRTPDSMLVGRWAKAAAATFTAMGSDYEKDYLAWKAITDGTFQIFEVATPATLDDVIAVDFSGITALDQVPAILTTKTQAAASSIASLATAVWSFDVYGRLVLTMPDTGDAAERVNIAPVSPAAGTDLAVVMDYANAVPVAGLDAETIVEAIDKIQTKDSTGYFITAKLDDDKTIRATEITSFCAKIESMKKIGGVLSDDPDILDPANTTNIFAKMKALGYKRTFGIYFESISSRPLDRPDAAGLGTVMPAQEGTTKFCQEEIVGVGVSGYIEPLSETATKVVTGHGGNVVERVGEVTYWFDGLTFGGEEIRIMMGRDWFVTRIQESIFSYTIQQPLTAFDNETLTNIAGFISKWGEEAIRRRILVDTVERPFLVNMPDEDEFTQAQRASHKLEAFDVFQAYLNSAVNEYKLIGTWTI